MRPRNQLHRTVCREAGTTAVEFVVVLSLFFMVLFGIMEFGVVVWEYNVVAYAAQNGARWAAVRGSNSASPATATQVQSYVNTQVLGLSVTVTTTWPDSAPSNGPGKRVLVQVATTSR